MQFISVLVSLLLTTAVIAKGGNKTMKVTDKSLCKEMASLTKLVSLASNETRLASKTKNNSTKIASIKEKASTAAIQLSTMSRNATLISTCATISAAEETRDACKTMAILSKLISLAVTQSQTKLDALMANTTLVSACASFTSSKKSRSEGTRKAAASEPATAAAASASASAGKTTSGAGFLNAQAGLNLSTMFLVVAGVMAL